MSQFGHLIEEAKLQAQPQKILLLFAKGTNLLPAGQTDYNSGTIEPIMCVDKDPKELTGFQDLVQEADSFSKNWNLIFISTLSGENNEGPKETDIDSALKKMSNIFANGEDLSHFMVLDRNEKAIIIS